MFDKLKYKIWRHLTKRMVKDLALRKVVLDAQKKSLMLKQQTARAEKVAPKDKVPTVSEEARKTQVNAPQNDSTIKRISIQGAYYSGSSAVVGFLQEFNNVRVLGFNEPQWSKSSAKGPQSECWFFTRSGFYEVVQAFYKSTPEEADGHIKKFLELANQACHSGGVTECEYLPDLYNSKFKAIVHELLMSILLLDGPTRKFMEKRDFPYGPWNPEKSEAYHTCNFIKGKGKKKYLFYSFAKLAEKDFRNHISDFLEKFFSLLDGSEFIAYDQLLHGRRLLWVNEYMRTPIRQVCVVRDPRDQYFSASQCNVDNWQPRTVDKIKSYLTMRRGVYPQDYPYRLVVRFEDLVLHYEETTQAIMDFFGLKKENHVAPKSIFDPSISVTNIGGWRTYHRQDFMKKIEAEMGEYCFYPEREKLSPENVAFLKSGGNWDDYPGLQA